MAGLFGEPDYIKCCCGGGCCSPRCEPLRVVTVGTELVEVEGACDNPLPLTLSIDLTGVTIPPGANCFTGSGTLTFKTPLSGGDFCWEGELSGNCVDCNGVLFSWNVTVKLCCDANLQQHVVSLVPGPGMLCPAVTLVGVNDLSVCDPFRITGCFPTFGACFVSCLDENFMPTDSPIHEVCYDIYEVPPTP